MMFTIPCHIPESSETIENLMLKFGNARRRAYSMKQKGVDRLEILKTLTRETGLHSRYVQTAYQMIKSLPPHVTFGGLALQRLRERGKITREEYRQRRNNLLACYGQAHFKGNLCLRVVGDELRVSVAPRKWIKLPIRIPTRYEQYRSYLNGTRPYRVVVRRRDDGKSYDVRISFDVDIQEREAGRVMALDINAGHIDFAVVEKQGLKPVAVGKVNCHELLSCRRGKNKLVAHKTVNKIRNVARHYGAEVVAGKLKTLTAKGRRHSNRKIHRMHQFRLRQVMRYKLPLSGVKFSERSEAHTSKIGKVISKPMGLDVHKASAYAFAVKVINYPKFTFLRGVLSNEGDGSLRQRLSGGSGPTALRQASSLAHDEARAETTPDFMGSGGGIEPFQGTILQVKGV